MAELRFDVKANFEQVTKLRSECEKLRAELLKTNKSTDPAIVVDLTEKYADASNRLKDLTQAASRAAYVMSSEFNKKMQAAAREVYSYELQMQATKDRIEKIQQQITNKRLTLGVTTDKSSIDSLQKNIDYLKGSLAGQTAQLKNLEGGAVGARQTLENMRNEYVLYAGSANPAKEATNMLTDSMSQMIERMKSAPTAGEGMSSLFQRVTGDAHMLSATLLGGLGFEQLAGSIFNTRSQFQQLEISFNTMLGSADKSKQLMDELIQTAAHTPFDMSSITSGAKQLLAYGTEAKDVNKTLVQLGDIASGLNIPLGELVYLYGTTVSQGRMFTMDLRQFMGRGVPLAEELGKILHQNTTEVQESVSKGKVTSDIFKEAIANMTQAGGRFGGLMEQQSKTLEGQWSNIGDSIQQMFNEIGKKSEGVFSSGLSIISAMVENWQEVIKVIGVATVAVGSYRASLMAAASIRKAEEAQKADDMMKGIDAEIKRLQDLENSNYKSLGKDKKQERVNKQQDLASIVGDTSVSDDFVKARLDAAEQEGVISAQMRSQLETKRELLQTQQQATAQSQIELDEEKRKTEELRQQKIESLKEDLKTTTEKISNLDDRDIELARQYTAALNDLQDAQDAFAEAQKLVEETADGANLAFDAEGNAVNALEAKERLATAAKKVNTAQTNVSTIASQQRGAALIREQLQERQATLQTQLNSVSQATNTTTKKASTLATAASTVKNAIHTASVKIMTTAELMLSNAVKSTTMALKGMWAAMLANPITGIITLVTTLASAVAMFGGEEEDISVDTKHFGDSAENTRAKVDGLLNVMRSSKEGTDAYNKAKEELIQTYEQFGIKCDAEKDNLTTLKGKHDEFVATLQLENAEREKANALMSATSQYTEARNKEDDNFSKDLSGHWYQGGQHVDKEDITSIQMMYNSIATDEVLDRLAKLKQRVDDSTLSYKEHIDAFNIYTNAVKKTFAPIDSFLEKQHYNIATIENTDHSILEHTSNLAKLKISYKNAEDAIMKAAAENVDWNNTQARSQWVAQQNKQSIDALTSSTDQLISIWNQEYGLNLKIHYDDTEIPSWMKSLTDKQLQSLINRRKADLNRQEQYRTNHKGSKLLTKQGNQLRDENANRLDVAMAGSILKDREAKRKADANKPKETTKKATPKKTTPKKTGATDDPQARAYERKKAEEDYSKSISSYSEKASDELSKRRTELIKNETEKEIAQINMSSDKEKKAIEDSIDKLVEAKKKKDQIVWVNSGKGRKANMWKQGKSDAEYRKEVLGTQMVDDKGNHLGKTIGQNSEDQIALIEKQRQLKLKEIQQAEIKDMLDFMKQYGSLEQQRYAILKEYTDKIDLAREKGDTFGAANAEMEMNDQLKKLNFSDFKDSINWDVVFQDMNRLSIPYLEDLRKKMKELLGSGTLEIDDMKTVSDQIYKIDDAISEQKDRWGLVNDAVREHRRLIDEAKDAQDRLAQARKGEFDAKADNMSQRRKIQGVFAESGVSIDTSNITSANKDKLMGSTKNLSVSQTEKLRKLFDDLAVSEVKVGKATKEVGKAQEEAKVKQDAAKKSLHDTIEEWAEGLRKIQEKLKDLPGLVDALGLGNTGFGKAVNNGMDALNSGTQAFSDFASGNYIGAAMNGIKTIGSLGKMFGIGGGNGAEVAKKTEELTESNDRLMYSIDKLKDSIDKSSGYTAVSNYNAAYDAQKQVNTQTMDILKTQMGYHGAHHSNAYYWNLSAQDYAAINKTLAQQSAVRGGYTNSSINKVNSLEDIYKLTPEQMADIRTHNADVWKNMTDQGKYDKTEYWEQYTELAGKLEELTEQINENLTQTTFDSMKSDFINNLMDMSKSAKDFSNDFTTMLNQSMLNFALGDLMNKKLKPLYESWANKMKENGGRQLTPTELNNLKEEYDKIVQEGLAIRDNIADITGYKQSYEQSASSGSFESMSQDTGEELNGRFTAVQIATEGTYEEAKLINTKLDAIAARDGGTEGSLLTASVNTIMGNVGNIWLAVDEDRTILAQSLMYLQSIDERQERWHKPMLQAFNDIHELKDKMSRL
jgi:predicted  nucleic acid-binding Zn-ribbon protein